MNFGAKEMSTPQATLPEFQNNANSTVSSDANAQLRSLAIEIKSRDCKATGLAIANGRSLILAKQILEHGGFGAWVRSEAGLQLRMAQIWMKLAEFAEGRDELVAGLGTTVAYKLAAPSTPDEVRNRAIEMAARGERVTLKMVDALVEREKKEKLKLPRPMEVDLGGLLDEITKSLRPRLARRFSLFIEKADRQSWAEFKKGFRSRVEGAYKEFDTCDHDHFAEDLESVSAPGYREQSLDV
jgi:hypothetical protein